MSTELAKYSRMTLLRPSFVVSGDNIYAKLGPVIGFEKLHEMYNENGDGSLLKRHLEMKGGAALDGQTTFGVNFNAGTKTSLSAEAILKLLWYTPTKGEVVKLLINGKDQTADMSLRA